MNDEASGDIFSGPDFRFPNLARTLLYRERKRESERVNVNEDFMAKMVPRRTYCVSRCKFFQEKKGALNDVRIYF